MEVEENQNEAKTFEQDETKSQNPNTELSSDSDSESESDDESQQTEEIKALEAELSNNPSNYEAHVKYINLLRIMGEIEKLKEAREVMSSLYPLTPSMWQDWAKDEVKLSMDSSESFSMVEKIYERGVSDYLSVSLWCDYLNFVQECDPKGSECSVDGISKARNLFERALTAGGLHVAEGNKIWEAFREFEHAILLTIDDADTKAKESQVQRIRSIFHRQLSVPLQNLRSTLLAYKTWEVEQGNAMDTESSDLDGISSHVASAYQKAMEMYNARAQHEEISKLDVPEQEKFQNFMNYLKFEKSAGDPARVQVLYERAITEFPVSSDLWLDYTRYLDKTLKVGIVVRDAYFRATKNCPWVGELWVRYLLSLERSRVSETEISTVFEKSLRCLFRTVDEYLDLFLTRVDGLRRRIMFGGEAEGASDYSLIRETMKRASDYLSPQLKNTDSLLHLHAYWARLELNLGKDLVAAREVWDNLLKISGSMLEAWQGYIAMEVEQGHINEARAIYRKCYSKRFTETGSEDICSSWLRFEREFGTLEDFDRAMQKVTPRLEEQQLYRVQQESNTFVGSTDQKENPIKKNAREKRKGGPKSIDEESPAKRKKETPKTQKASNQEKEQDYNSGKPKGYTDQCTAFISNIDLKANEEDLRKFFSDVGGVKAIRLLHDKFTGKSRGLAYVDFSDDKHLEAAINKNKKLLFGKKLSITRSNPKESKQGGHGFSNQQTRAADKSGKKEESASNVSTQSSEEIRAPFRSNLPSRRLDDNIQLKGKNTMLVPRNVRPLGVQANKPKSVAEGDEKPKSNDEFRKMLIKD